MNATRKNSAGIRGFTFIEVLVAMLIFTLAVIAASTIADGAVKATRDSKDVSVASWLVQSAMVDLETRLETEGVDKGCEKKKEGKFEAPYEKFSYTVYCTEIDFNISESASKMAAAAEGKEDNDPNREDQVLKMILQLASDYMTKSLRELHVEVTWLQGKNKRQVAATTHFARYDQAVQLPALGAPQQ